MELLIKPAPPQTYIAPALDSSITRITNADALDSCIAHHQPSGNHRDIGYFAEPPPILSPPGIRILFNSNWSNSTVSSLTSRLALISIRLTSHMIMIAPE